MSVMCFMLSPSLGLLLRSRRRYVSARRDGCYFTSWGLLRQPGSGASDIKAAIDKRRGGGRAGPTMALPPEYVKHRRGAGGRRTARRVTRKGAGGHDPRRHLRVERRGSLQPVE